MSLADYFECTIDFEGQRLAENVVYLLLVITSVVGFFTGYTLESIQMTLAIFAFGVLSTCLIVIPPWPMFRRHSVQWVAVDSKQQVVPSPTEKTDLSDASL
ncbi:microsomal signal peptidase 12 kDa subunit-domain-containing protein [Chlamydoabsidia padenii]|nr:microsomal signal peptidase 12 kDa subunit-domain-containing protein [Chlamydoabsidia padenii]